MFTLVSTPGETPGEYHTELSMPHTLVITMGGNQYECSPMVKPLVKPRVNTIPNDGWVFTQGETPGETPGEIQDGYHIDANPCILGCNPW